jgi:hypothetical protein
LLNKAWLPLNEYSNRYRVSLSTLRRRIRANEVEFRFEEGKYWLPDSPIAKPPHGVEMRAPSVRVPESTLPPQLLNDVSAVAQPEGLLNSAQNLLQELKNAYVKVLLDKEEQISQLKEEVIDLKTLVKILESENDRLKTNLGEAAPIDSWLDKNLE